MNCFYVLALDDGVFDEQVVIDGATVDVARALDGDSFSGA